MEPVEVLKGNEAQEAEKSSELEALRAIYMEELVTVENDPAHFQVELISTERRDPVRVVIGFRHPAQYPDQPIHVEADMIEGLPEQYKQRLTEKLQEKMIGSASAFPIVELAKEWIEHALLKEEHTQDTTFFNALTQVMQTEAEESADTRDFVAYSCWTEEDLLGKQNKTARKVADNLSLSMPLATVLCRYFEWNVDKLYVQYLKQPEQILHQAGVSVQAPPPQAQAKGGRAAIPKVQNCLICDEPSTAVKVETFLACRHPICIDCWVQYLTVKVRQGDVNSVRCPSYKCTCLVPDDVVERLLDADLMGKYRRWVLRGFLAKSHVSRWCPKRDCSNVVRAPGDVSCMVRCLCGHLFCFACGDEAHYPALCESVKAWRSHYSSLEQEARAQEWLRANTKPCVRCKAFIEKNGGCNHMTCKKCTYEFCWICGANWSGSHYACSREDPTLKNNKKSQESLTRFTYFSDRFTAHDVSSRLEEVMRARVTAKAAKIMESVDKRLWHNALYVLQAAEILIRCRLVLKWSFPLNYEPPKGMNVPLFEFLQSDFDVAVEKLAYWLEHNSTDTKELHSAMTRAEHLLCGFLQFCEQEQHTKFYLRALMATSLNVDFSKAAPDRRDLRSSGNKARASLSQSSSVMRHTKQYAGGRLYTMENTVPLPIDGIASGLRIAKLSASSSGHVLALTNKGLVFGWGANSHGQLGVGDYLFRQEPTLLHDFTDESMEPPADLIANNTHSFALMPNGRVYGWGNNNHCQLGIGGKGYSCASPSRLNVRLEDHIVVQIATGSQHTLFLTQEGVLYGCGDSVASGSWSINDYPVRNPFFNPETTPIRRIGGSDASSFAITREGVLHTWGFVGSERYPAPQVVVAQRRGDTVPRFRDIISSGVGVAYATSQDLKGGAPIKELYIIQGSQFYTVKLPEPIALFGSDYREVHAYSVSRVLYCLKGFEVLQEQKQFSSLPLSTITMRGNTMYGLVPEDHATLSGSLRRALEEGLCADVIFVVQGQELPANRALLLARCAAFAKEAFASATDTVRLQLSAKLDVTTVRTFLEFLYTDNIEDVPQSSLKSLLALGRQYNLPRLIAVCRNAYMPSTLGADLNAARSTETTDAEIDTPDGIIKAHKVVLAARIPYFSAVLKGGKPYRSGDSISSWLSGNVIINWCYECEYDVDGFYFDTLAALLADIDYLGGPTPVQALAEQTLLGMDLVRTNPMIFSDIVPFAPPAIIRTLVDQFANQPEFFRLEERYAHKVTAFAQFVANVKERHDVLSVTLANLATSDASEES